VAPVLLVVTDQAPPLALVAQDHLTRTRDRLLLTLAVGVALQLLGGRLLALVVPVVVVRDQPRQAYQGRQTPEVVAVEAKRLLVEQAAQGSSWYARSSVALLRVSQRRVARKRRTRVTARMVSLVRTTRFTRLLLAAL